ncbi:hypothetical protein [Streptomyces sp. NPDC046712]|uniref:rhodanese-like domain-containing protein n=1 Tax=Streptomyces sp. NPDC046712 TaxID=3154802 RepID=UPI0033CD0D9B
MRDVGLDDFAAEIAHVAFVVGVRESDECMAGHVPGARSVPLSELGAVVSDLPGGRPLVSGTAVLTA